MFEEFALYDWYRRHEWKKEIWGEKKKKWLEREMKVYENHIKKKIKKEYIYIYIYIYVCVCVCVCVCVWRKEGKKSQILNTCQISLQKLTLN